ncbi:MAG TPA: LamG-like jellyroll fold domain-containing protein [Capsulimonadaceae bacterium]|jgi:hypothetical protein
MQTNKIIAAFAAASYLAIPQSAFAQGPVAPGPGQAGVPVIFWAHYMPQVPLGLMHVGTDVSPFVTQNGSETDQMERTMRSALASGINGFQSLVSVPDGMFEAAKRIRETTGETFYIAPEWCDMGDDVVKSANTIATFALKHAGDPSIATVNGKQVHFFYGDVVWAKGDGLAKARQIIKDRGAQVLLNPTISCFDRWALGREDLARHKAWPAFQVPTAGTSDWFKACEWDGATAFGTNWRSDVADLLTTRLKERGDSFTFYPDIWPGYDSSNREFQAIHVRYPGIANLRDSLKVWVSRGFKQLSCITWNDMNETLLMPSSRNVFGYSEVLRYYHELAATGRSPFDAPKFVVSYQEDVLLGDQAFFQCLVIPERGAVSSDYVVTFRFEDITGREVSSLAGRMWTSREDDDKLIDLRLDTTHLPLATNVLTPYVSVRRIDHSSGESQVVYDNLRLAPVRIRFNNVFFPVPVSIALDHIASDSDVALIVQPNTAFKGARLATASAVLIGKEPLRKLVLAEGAASDGAFRADDTIADIPAGDIRVQVRVGLAPKVQCRMTIDGGKIEERYTAHYDERATRKLVGGPTLEYPSQAMWGPQWNLFRITAKPTATLKLDVDIKGKADTTTVALADVLKGPVLRTLTTDGKPTVARFTLTADTVDANIDFPLPAAGSYTRTIPATASLERERIFHAYALTETDKVAYSKPVVLVRGAQGKSPVTAPVKFVQSRGTYDDFVDDSSETSRNPYKLGDIVNATLPLSRIPYYALSLDEGVGAQLNDAAVGQQYGRARVDGDYEWIADGKRGGALKLGATGKIHVRSKSWPYSTVTVSTWLRAAAGAPANAASTAWFGPFRINLRAGKVDVTQRFTGLTASGAATLASGWNHVALVYDLSTLTVYVNGKLVATSTAGTPVVQRTHWVPEISIAALDNKPALLDGGIDQVEVIATSLNAADIKALYEKGQWLGAE